MFNGYMYNTQCTYITNNKILFMYFISNSMWNGNQLVEKTDTTELDDRLES